MKIISKIIVRYKLPNHLDRDIVEELVLPGFLSPGDPVFSLCGSIFACVHSKISTGSSLPFGEAEDGMTTQRGKLNKTSSKIAPKRFQAG